MTGLWRLEILYGRCSINSSYCYFQKKTLTVSGDGLCACLSLIGTKSKAKMNKCDMWKWFRKNSLRVSTEQGNPFILLRERNTGCGVGVATNWNATVLLLIVKPQFHNPALWQNTTPHPYGGPAPGQDVTGRPLLELDCLSEDTGCSWPLGVSRATILTELPQSKSPF